MKIRTAMLIGLGLLTPTASVFGQSAASLGRPVATSESTSLKPTVRGASPDPLRGEYIPAARLGPISDVRFGPDPSSESFSSPEERYNWGLPERPANNDYLQPRMRATPTANTQSHFGEKMGDWFGGDSGGNGAWANLESDHCFDDFISPMSNPFLFEDPRSLTELRPIFFYQTISGDNSTYHGGNIEFFGLQGRIAITQRFSIVLSKLGGVVINPGSGSVFGSSSGFSEIWLGPKYTWYRDEQTGTISAAGLIFQVPTGPSSVFQDTGSLSLVPYINVGQRFGKTSWGAFNVIDTLGFAFATDDQRSNYFYNSFHIDFNVANWNRIYPLLELNWFHYTRDGHERPNLNFEGRDVANVGAPVAGRDYFSLAIGARYKVSEAVQFGIATEFPLGNSDLFHFRLGVDMIWRY